MHLVSYEFMTFMAVLLVLYYLIPHRFQWVLLLAASYLFYICGGAFYLAYPLLTTVSTWFLAGQIGKLTSQSKEYIKEQNLDREQRKAYNRKVKKKQRFLMILGLVFNFGILAVLKYFNFVLQNINGILGLAGVQGEFSYVNWLLPLGISYYTFQSMGYLIDVYYRKYDPERNLARFALFVSFFPQLVAGPICRFDQMKAQLYSGHDFRVRTVKLGLWRMLWGYFKKLVVADRLGPAVIMLVSSPKTYDGIYVLLGMVGYTIWMYADFSGGMDIVLGAGQLFGIKLPENFERPFFSKNLAEFWRRWHMSLMLWLREYIFFPVSTSRFCQNVSRQAGRWWGKEAGRKAPVYVASLTVWLVAGIWHGASWNFVIWGLANCLVMLISQELTGWYRRFRKRAAFAERKGYRYFQIIRTFFLFCFLEMFEYYPFKTVFTMLGSLFTSPAVSRLWDGGLEGLGIGTADMGILAAGIFLMFAVSAAQRRGSVREKLEGKSLPVQYGVVFGLFLVVLITGIYGQGYDASQFIYNQY